MVDSAQYGEFLFHLARLGLAGRSQDVQAYLRRIIRRVQQDNETLARQLSELAARAPSLESPFRDAGLPMVPVDADSRLQLLRQEYPVSLDHPPVLADQASTLLAQVVAERRQAVELANKGLEPTRSLLFVGPPGVGKTMTARWLCAELGKPLFTLDLSAVMSSFLGKTGSNLRNILDYAKSSDCVLLLDEFDSIAKRRDDEGEIGELKRLVTVLLQEIDDWPATGLMIAATNHGNLLDPAVWRRFDHIVPFSLPDRKALRGFVRAALKNDDEMPEHLCEALSYLFQGLSFSDASRRLGQARRKAVVHKESVQTALEELTRLAAEEGPLASRKAAAAALRRAGIPDRQIHRLTGVARDTLRRMTRDPTKNGQIVR